MDSVFKSYVRLIEMHLTGMNGALKFFFLLCSTECLEMWDSRHSGGRIKKGSDEPEREGAPLPPPPGLPAQLAPLIPAFC